MTNAGWYPDPAGAPDTYRYWDGQAWSQMTTTQPSGGAASSAPAAPAAPATPPPPATPPTALPPAQQQPYQQQYQQPSYEQPGYQQQYQQPQPTWSPTPPPGGGSGGGSGKTVGIIVAGVLVLVLLGVGGFFGIRALSGDDDGGDKKADDPTSQGTDPTDDPTDATSSTVRPSGIQCTGGKPEPATEPDPKATSLSGGGLTIPKIDGYTIDARQSPAHTYADGFISQIVEVVPQQWISLYGVGAIPRANGFEGVDTTAEIVMQCLTTNDRIYKGFKDRKDLENEETTVDGKPAHRITSEIRVDDASLPIEGDATTVIVVDTGDPASYGVFIGVAPIGDAARIAQEDQIIEKISVG